MSHVLFHQSSEHFSKIQQQDHDNTIGDFPSRNPRAMHNRLNRRKKVFHRNHGRLDCKFGRHISLGENVFLRCSQRGYIKIGKVKRMTPTEQSPRRCRRNRSEISKSFQKLDGIHFKYYPPYASERNGIAERLI